jgi:hypothetical protein
MVCDNSNCIAYNSINQDAELAQLKFDTDIEEKLLKFYEFENNLCQIETEIIVDFNSRYLKCIEISNDDSMSRFLDSVHDITPFQRVYDIPDEIDNDERARIIIQRIHSELNAKPGNENILDMVQQYHDILDEKSRYESSLPDGFLALYDNSDDEDEQA